MPTATPIAAALGVPVEDDPRLVELDYGEWDERSFSEFPPEDLVRWRTDASFAPPGGESLLAVGARVASLCGEVIDGGPVIAVSHVSPIKAAALWAMDGDPLLGVADAPRRRVDHPGRRARGPAVPPGLQRHRPSVLTASRRRRRSAAIRSGGRRRRT